MDSVDVLIGEGGIRYDISSINSITTLRSGIDLIPRKLLNSVNKYKYGVIIISKFS